MFRVPSLGRLSVGRTSLITVVLLLMLLGGASGMAGAPTASTSHRSPSLAPAAFPSSAPPAAGGSSASDNAATPQPAVAAHPAAAPTISIPFWGNNSTFGHGALRGPAGCQVYAYNYSGLYNYSYSYCYSDAVDPTVLHLANGRLGVSYGVDTNTAPIPCTSAVGVNLTSRVHFSVSSDGGLTFASAHDLGNYSSCAYPNAIEPSFTVASDGTILGVYVEDNFTGAQHEYTSRSADALGFTLSSNNGATFTQPRQLALGNVANPQITTFGSSVYVLYENIANWTNTTICYGSGSCGAYPTSLDLLYSSDGGATWSGPTLLPGQNGTNGYATFGGWVQVNATGTVGVSYFTNQKCVQAPYGYCYDYGADLVFSTSTNNGTTWSTPTLAAGNIGEDYSYAGFYLPSFFQMVPTSQFVFSSDGQTAYVVYDGTFSKNFYYYYYNYRNSGVFEATGPTTGSAWVNQSLAAMMNPYNYDDIFHPSIGWVGSTLYATFTWFNDTYCYGSCPPTDYTFSQWQTSSADGASWSAPTVVDQVYLNSACSYVWCLTTFLGQHSSVGALNATYPVFGFTMGSPQKNTFVFQSTGSGYNYWSNYSYEDRLEVAFPYSGPTITINFTENNLPAGTNWSFNVGGATISTTSQSVLLTDVPPGLVLAITADPVPAGYRTIITPSSSVAGEASFTSNATVWFNFSVSFGLQFWINPITCADCGIEVYQNGTYLGYDAYTYDCPIYCTPYFNAYPSFPWYFPSGSQITIQTYSYPTMTAAYWNGSGVGSVNGPSNWINLTVGSPINQTVWWGGFGSYAVNVGAIGLPSTSTYSFAFDGVSYSAAGTSSVEIQNVITGVHTVDSISATSSTAGWEYFGYSTPRSPVLEPAAPNVNLSFAYVDVAGTPGTISFEAQGISWGTVWTFSFNGTTYSSDTPWINVTGQPGTYPVGGFPITALNASVGYTPTGVPLTMSVTTGSTYVIQYVEAFKVSAVAGTGGSITNSGSFWVAGGATLSFHATVHANYEFGGWTGTGLGSYTGTNSYANVTANGPIEETAMFFPQPTARFNLTMTETGVPAGTLWTVFLGTVGYSSNQTAFQISNLYACGNPLGTYNLTIPYVYSTDGLSRYVPTSHLARTVCTTGTTNVAEVFAPQYFLSLSSTIGGYASATVGSTSTTTGLWAPNGAPVSLSAFAEPGYQFLGWNGTGPGNYTGAGLQWSIALTGPVTELAVFAQPVPPPVALFGLTFQLAAGAVAAGTTWSVTVGGVGYSSSTTSLYVPGLTAGTYTLTVSTVLSPDGLTKYTPLAVQPSITVTHNATYPVSFAASYWVSVSGTPGGTTSPGSGWVVAGSTVLLSATPADGFLFVSWTGTGAAAWTGTDNNHTLVVTSSVTEVATFRAVQVTITSQSGVDSLFAQPWLWAVFGAIGLVAGVLAGVVLSRRGRRPPAMSPAESAPDPSASESYGTEGGSP